MRPQVPASRRVGPEMARLLRPRPLHDSYSMSRVGSASSHSGHFRPNADPIGSLRGSGHNVQKERRICDTLEPVIQSHRLVVNQALVQKDNEPRKRPIGSATPGIWASDEARRRSDSSCPNR